MEAVGSKSYNQCCVVLVLISGKINIILRSGTENICVHMLLQSQAFIHYEVPCGLMFSELSNLEFQTDINAPIEEQSP